ncbi:hypothetical protein Ocin01_19289 [Orchesella cincta]|uniref:O-acyltransferase WSD1 C-terminal domain-containing protein n=1 Tax=Orchesella cincta TaxID=48709 RepID=A0A1D2M347_ORCCI|nr:hypothetical protein Ocin01_19289 [Orchesella cincta]
MTLKGIISADEMRTLFVKTVLEKRQPQNPKLLQFPELKQYQTKHLGFLFYRNDPNFKIENYIHEDISQKDDPDFRSLETILENVSYRPYPRKGVHGKCSWCQIFKDPKFQPNSEPTTLLVLRIHHTQIDGYSLLNVLVKGLAQKATRAIEGRNPKAVGKVFQRLTQPIPINLVKKVAHRYNVRVPAVLMALVGQNLTKIFEKSEKSSKNCICFIWSTNAESSWKAYKPRKSRDDDDFPFKTKYCGPDEGTK